MKKSSVIYFLPTLSESEKEELDSISNVVEIIKNENIDIKISPSWSDLILKLQDNQRQHLLIVFRLDFIERKDMSIDEVLSMLSSLIKFIGSKHDINVGIVVPKLCSKELISNFKRNNVLGIIPGMRFFDKESSINAYNELIQGRPHWPALAIQEYSTSKSKNVTLTDRQYEIFNLIARRGYTNKQVSQMLSISEDTVKFHVGTIFKKYGVKNRTQLALAVDSGLITYH